MHIVLQTPRLMLRRLIATDEDALLICQLNSDPLVIKYIHEPALQNIEATKNVLAKIILSQYKTGHGR